MLVQLALYSDRFYMAAVGVYVFAMVLHGWEFARERTAAPVLVGEHSEAVDEPSSPTGSARPPAERMGRMGVALVVLGAGLQFVSIVLRGLAAQRWPLGNMYEFISVITLAAVLTWLVVLPRGTGLRPLGAFLLFPVVILQFLGGTVLYTQAAPVMPALQSYWLVVHVTTVSIASGLFFVPGIASILFLLQSSGRLPTALASKVPSADALDRLAYRVTIIAFPLYTFAVIAGAIWAEAAWGRFWGWDPKETWALITWVVYAGYLHTRITLGWAGKRPAAIAVFAFAVVVFTFMGVNLGLTGEGLHTYGAG